TLVHPVALVSIDEPARADPPTDAHQHDLEAGKQKNGVQRFALRHVAQYRVPVVDASKRDPPGQWRDDAEDGLDQGGFAGTVGPEQPAESTASENQVYILQNRSAVVTDHQL